MEANHKKILKAVVLELRHMLEGYYDGSGWHAGDLEQRLNSLGVWRDRNPLRADEMAGVSAADREARQVVDAYLKLRDEAGVPREEAVAEFVRETAYTWANRVLALRCIEARELIDEVILQKEVYGGRSLEHNRLAQRHPELCAGDDDGLFAALEAAFARQAEHLPLLFDPKAPGVALKPGVAALKRAISLLSGTEAVRGQDPATGDVFRAPDAFGWAYQYWNTEEKDRIFEKVRMQKGTKIEGADIIPATQLYTEPYMVKFLLQNSLGATWVRMHPETDLSENWEYFIKCTDQAKVQRKPVQEITLLDPACGSGHFLLEAFDLFYQMYEEENEITAPEVICRSILENNLHGIDIDGRAIQISEAALWMKAAEKGFRATGSTSFSAVPVNLVATNIRLPKGVNHLKVFLDKHPEDKDLSSALEVVFAGLENADELGSLLQLESPVEARLRELERLARHATDRGVQTHLYKSTPIQGQLPVGHESYEQWKTLALARLRKHLMEESEAADLGQAFFSRSVEKALRFLDVLAKRYDVVATNPPFMGSKSMPTSVKAFVSKNYPHGKRDLLAAFILRALGLVCPNSGTAAVVSQQTTLLLKSYAALRGDESTINPGFLRADTIESIVQLGSGAFGEISGVVVSPILMVLRIGEPSSDHRLIGIRTTDCSGPEQKAERLRYRCRNPLADERYSPAQSSFLAIDRTPLAFWLPDKLLVLFQNDAAVSNYALVRQGICTTNNDRFLRFEWEIADLRFRWFRAAKGGGFGKWRGFEQILIDWQYNGCRVKRFQEDTPGAIDWSGRMPADDYFFKGGWSYSAVATAIGARMVDEQTLFLDTAPIAIPKASEKWNLVGGLLNSRVASYLVRSLTQDAKIREGYVQRIPWPAEHSKGIEAKISSLVDLCVLAKCELLSSDPAELLFDPEVHGSRNRLRVHLVAAVLCSLEYEIDRAIADEYQLAIEELNTIFAHTGFPAAQHALLGGYDNYASALEVIPSVVSALAHPLELHSRSEVHPEKIKKTKVQLRALYEAESPRTVDVSDNDSAGDEEDESELGSEQAFKIPTESTIERMAQELRIHPLSVYLLLEEGIEQDGWLSVCEEQQYFANRFSVLTLRFLGHRWPRQIAAGERIPDWADPDGIIPLTHGTQSPLIERVRQRIASELGIDHQTTIEGEFAAVMGRRLEQWLALDFFEYNTTQFKKRPVAWQIQSGRFDTRRQPAFSALVHYHKVGPQILATVQSQYVRPLRQRFETELRGIESVPQKARSDRQQDRLSELMNLIAELRQFDEALDSVSRGGFGPERHYAQLRQYAIEDAMLCLKSHWLDKLSTTIGSEPSKEWRRKANDTQLHCELSRWIANAMTTLRYHCSSVGPKAPKQEALQKDSIETDLASLISQDADNMVSCALGLACTVWWAPLDNAVFAPLRAHIKEAKDEQKRLKEEDITNASDPYLRKKEIEFRSKELKESGRRWQRELDEKTETADKLRKEILAWSCPEARTWGGWLASQPMYDAISSLDGVRKPPQTVADFVSQESAYAPDINDGVRVNIAPLQKAGLLAADVLSPKDVDKAIADRAAWRADERRWCREGKLTQPGWWNTEKSYVSGQD